MPRVTLEEVLAARTPRGSFTRAQIEAWGLPWPPPHGWVKELTGDPNAKIPAPGRRQAAIDMARKTRVQLEQEIVSLHAVISELRKIIIDMEAKGKA